jgi:hypothetical protein
MDMNAARICASLPPVGTAVLAEVNHRHHQRPGRNRIS